MRRPAKTPVTLSYGYHEGYPLHNGVHVGTDFAYDPDDTVYAPFDGVVTYEENNGDDGNAIYMTQGDYFIGLCHLDHALVANGTIVQVGQPIAKMGDTGFAEGKHLHFAVKYRNEFTDPESVIDKEDNMTLTADDVHAYILATLYRDATPGDIKEYTGKSLIELRDAVDRSDERKKINGKVWDYDHLYQTALGAQVAGASDADKLKAIQEILKNGHAQQ